MSKDSVASRRFAGAAELVVCAALLAVVALFALWKMDYIGSSTPNHLRMTDQSRTAMVAKNIVEGRGYTANDIPANLVDFYDDRGKLRGESWTNADRFPFVAYAIAALYTITGSTSPEVGIVLYNVLFFVGSLTLIYWLAGAVWRDRYSAIAAVALALLHPGTYWFVYMKDGDMLFLMTACLICLYYYAHAPRREMSWRLALVTGTMVAWLFLCRPNLGATMVAFFGGLALHRLWLLRGSQPVGRLVLDLLRREGIALLVMVLWCIPYAVHSLHEWGTPFFSANGIYQLPLGTPFAMGTDTWWKYSDPAQQLTLGTLVDQVPGDVISKFTTSWAVTFRSVTSSYAMELLLAFGVLGWLAARRISASPAVVDASGAPAAASEPDPRWVAIRLLAAATGVAFVLNLAILPLYGYQNQSYRYYLAFMLPVVWLAAGHGVVLVAHFVWPHLRRGAEWLWPHRGIAAVLVIAIIIVWNFGQKSSDANVLFAGTARFAARHWLIAPLALVALLAHGLRWRRVTTPSLVAFLLVVVTVRFQPQRDVKFWNFMYLSQNDHQVAQALKEGKGIVSSFALQGEVAWLSGRRNIPAPEWVMHLYSYYFDHGIEAEDVYIESAETLTSPYGGPFAGSAPGFEGYARLQQYRGTLPGYQQVFYSRTLVDYPKFQVTTRPKASSVYRLVDRDAFRRMAKSPDRLDLGDISTIVHTAHGFGGYFTVDGTAAVAATDSTQSRRLPASDRAWESSSVTFFLDDERRPSHVELELFATHPTTLQFYWNLDLFRYDRGVARNLHHLGTVDIDRSGWQRVRIPVPREVTRKGLNKLGFRAGSFQSVVACPDEFGDQACLSLEEKGDTRMPTRILRSPGLARGDAMRVSAFVGALAFQYGAPVPPGTTPARLLSVPRAGGAPAGLRPSLSPPSPSVSPLPTPPSGTTPVDGTETEGADTAPAGAGGGQRRPAPAQPSGMAPGMTGSLPGAGGTEPPSSGAAP